MTTSTVPSGDSSSGTSYTNEQVAMTLAAIAYADEIIEPTIKCFLAEKSLATNNEWDLVWGPHNKDTNQAYVVKNKGSGVYALAIRGTEGSDPFSWFLDAELKFKPLPWDSSAEAQVSHGMEKIWKHITEMPDLDSKDSLQDYFNGVESDSTVIVTGHSQGGASASMMALWLQNTFTGFTVQPYTFAGETAGDAGFASLYTAAFGTGEGGRYVNDNDVVPRAFADLDSLADLYSSESITMPGWISDLVTALIKHLKKLKMRVFLHNPSMRSFSLNPKFTQSRVM